MDTTFVLGLMLGFFAIPGIVIGAGLLLIKELKPGYLTKHKEKVLAIVCIILAIYGASMICTESEGGDRIPTYNSYGSYSNNNNSYNYNYQEQRNREIQRQMEETQRQIRNLQIEQRARQQRENYNRNRNAPGHSLFKMYR